MLRVSRGSVSSVQPNRPTGSSSGAVNARASTVTGPRPAPSRYRARPTAWYMCVEDTCTLVGVPIIPDATTSRRAWWAGMNGECSATCTSPVAPTSAQSDRSPSTSGAGGVSASTGTDISTISRTASGVTGHGVAVTTSSGRSGARPAPGTAPVTSSSIVRTVGTPHSASTCAPRSAVRVTTPVQRNRSGMRRATRTKNSARHPDPTTPNRTGCVITTSSSPDRR